MGSKQSSHSASNNSKPKSVAKETKKEVRGRESTPTPVVEKKIVIDDTPTLEEEFVSKKTSANAVVPAEDEFDSEESFEESDYDSDDEEDDDEEFEALIAERRLILEDAKKLKKLAVDYAHPELPVVTTDGLASGRNYFERPSAPQQESLEDAEERAQILADAAALKQMADFYAHPERPVVTTDSTACGRNYFSRPSAPEQESVEEAEERAQILADLKALKKLAVDYAHPELPIVTTDATACGRNYFSRPSAPEQESVEEAEERAQILADAVALKKLAVDYAHPELPVVTTDATACGRNYFSRASAPEQESVEDMEERERILADMKALKKLAVDYAHPELPVVTTDATACGRNYLSRPSAPEQESVEDMEERELILAEMKALKKLAVDYAHPELPVVTTDATACGRNYFSRPSAPEQESKEEADEVAQILADAAALKKLAVDYAHPELPVVTTDPTASGRNYFSRPSAPEQESAEEAEERAQIMADLKALKKLAVDYAHPELPVVTTDPTACGRNYFRRASAKGNFEVITSTADPVDFQEIKERFHLSESEEVEDEEHLDEFIHHLHDALHAQGHSFKHNADKTKSMPSPEEEESISRSPSSVMLFGLDATEGY